MSETTNNEPSNDQLEAHRACLLRQANAYCHNEQEAKDLVQEVFRRFLKHSEKNLIAHPRAFLRRTLANLATDLLRHQKTHPRAEIDLCQLEAAEHEPEPTWCRVSDGELLAAIGRLEEKQRQAVRAYYFDKKSHKEIANESGCKEGTIGSRLHRALEKLRAILEKRVPR